MAFATVARSLLGAAATIAVLGVAGCGTDAGSAAPTSSHNYDAEVRSALGVPPSPGDPTRPTTKKATATKTGKRASNVGCDSAWRSAASVPQSMSNDEELDATVRKCGSFDQWVAGYRANPDALLPDSTMAELTTVLRLSCGRAGMSAPVCADAQSQGYI